jgi:hypothetical protein
MASPWLLVISKHPEFSSTGEVVLGQCEPYTPGWRLRLYREGEEYVLINGTYYDLRKIQQDCTGKSFDDIQQYAAKARDLLANNRHKVVLGTDETTTTESSPTETDILLSSETQLMGVTDIEDARTNLDEETRVDHDLSDETHEYLPSAAVISSFEVTRSAGLLIADVINAGILTDIEGLLEVLKELMEMSNGAIVLDMRRVDRLEVETARTLAQFTNESMTQNRYVALASVGESILRNLQEMDQDEVFAETRVVVYMDLESAIADARDHLQGRQPAGEHG